MSTLTHGFKLADTPQFERVNTDGKDKLRFTGSEALAVIEFAQVASEVTRPRLELFCASPDAKLMPYRYQNQVTHVLVEGKVAKLGLAHTTDRVELHADKTRDMSRKVVSYIDTPLTSFPWEDYAKFRAQFAAEQQGGGTALPARQDKSAGHGQQPHGKSGGALNMGLNS